VSQMTRAKDKKISSLENRRELEKRTGLARRGERHEMCLLDCVDHDDGNKGENRRDEYKSATPAKILPPLPSDRG